MACYALLNQTTKPAPFGALTPPLLQQLAAGVDAWLNGDVSNVWNGSRNLVTAVRYADDGIAKPNEVPVYLVDDLAAFPQVGAYHDIDTGGVPLIYVACNEYDAVVSNTVVGSSPLSVGVAHEIGEAEIDPEANLWADRADGVTQEAYEICDRVQGTDYTGDAGVVVPNFLTPAAFSPGAKGPFDFKSALANPYDITPQGYAITRAIGPTTQATAALTTGYPGFATNTPAFMRKRHPLSRVYRRGVRL